jgi:phosphate transport system permease protein
MAFEHKDMSDVPAVATAPPRRIGVLGDRIFFLIVLSCGLIVLIALLAALVSMLRGGMLAFHTFGLGFLTGTEWDPVAQQFAGLVPIYGTLVTSALAMLIGVPVSFGIAVFVTEVAPRSIRGPVGGAIELLAGIPSIIYGMWGLFVFAPFMADNIQPVMIDWLGPIPLVGALFTGIPLGIMVIPYISSVMRDVFLVVPPQLKESAYALGSTRWEVVRDIVLPHTRTAVVGGIFLGLGRALGETMAVTFVLGNTHNIAVSLMEPGTSIAATLANEFSEASDDLYRSALTALGLILFVVTFIVLALAKAMLVRMARRRGE